MLPNWFVAYFGRPRTAPPELLARLRAGEKLPCVKCSTMVLPITFVRQRGGCKNCILSLREKLVFPDDVVQAYARKAIEQPSVKRFWQCPGCGGILEKNEATRRAVGQLAGLAGSATCSFCGSSQSASEVYSVAFDFVESDDFISNMGRDQDNVSFDQRRMRCAYCGQIVALKADLVTFRCWRCKTDISVQPEQRGKNVSCASAPGTCPMSPMFTIAQALRHRMLRGRVCAVAGVGSATTPSAASLARSSRRLIMPVVPLTPFG